VAKELLFAVFRGDLSGTNPDGYSTVEQAIDKEGLWFQKLSEEQYEKLATQVLKDEKGILMQKFEPHFSKGKKYPEGQLMFLVGKMMRSGPAEQMEAKDAQETLRRLIERYFENLW
jgi:aspartyl-tRNA(Asn)/glutamyl-tRNA(Gln) amidotransferase subunit B